jgi:hypothetical protein
MTRKRLYRPPPDLNLTETELRTMSRPVELPAQPWRYTLTPKLVTTLVRVAECTGQMRAAPFSYYRRKELEARSKRIRVLWTVSHMFTSARPEEVETSSDAPRTTKRTFPGRWSRRPTRSTLAYSRQLRGSAKPEARPSSRRSDARHPRCERSSGACL